jgi:hypothetical protein
LNTDPANPEMDEAIEMSKVVYLSELASQLSAEPSKEEPNTVSLNLRLPTGKAVKRRFLKSDPLSVVEAFCKLELNDVYDLKLICAYPRKEFKDMKALIGTLFDSDTMVIVDKA